MFVDLLLTNLFTLALEIFSKSLSGKRKASISMAQKLALRK